MKQVYQCMAFKFISSHLHPLQVENCNSNSRLVVDEDANGELKIERVKRACTAIMTHKSAIYIFFWGFLEKIICHQLTWWTLRPSNLSTLNLIYTRIECIEWRDIVDQVQTSDHGRSNDTIIGQVRQSCWLWGNLIMVGCVLSQFKPPRVLSGFLAVKKASAFSLGPFFTAKNGQLIGLLSHTQYNVLCWALCLIWDRSCTIQAIPV